MAYFLYASRICCCVALGDMSSILSVAIRLQKNDYVEPSVQ